MNERIKELADQAGLESFYVEYSPWQIPFENFAELIVQECAEVASSYDGAHYVGTAIKQHFGVEE